MMEPIVLLLLQNIVQVRIFIKLGGSLKELIGKTTINEAVFRTRLENFAKGFNEFHEARFVHRSICPQHILVDEKGEWKLMLFGLTRFIKQLVKHPYKDELDPSYNSPESFGEEGFKRAADMWALGCTLYEVCTHAVYML